MSPKTKKREAEIAEIKRKREMRLQLQKDQAEQVKSCICPGCLVKSISGACEGEGAFHESSGGGRT
eukprot:447158-Hanusia_phi.AAC.5